MVACALAGSRINYPNFVLYGAAQKNICKSVVTTSFRCSSCTLPQQFHCLPNEYRINFKTANVTFCTLHSTQPKYLYLALHAHRWVAILMVLSCCQIPTPSLQLFKCVPVLKLFVIILRPTVSSRPSNLLRALVPAPQIQLLLIYYIYLLTYIHGTLQVWLFPGVHTMHMYRGTTKLWQSADTSKTARQYLPVLTAIFPGEPRYGFFVHLFQKGTYGDKWQSFLWARCRSCHVTQTTV